jgi:adenylate cyclase
LAAIDQFHRALEDLRRRDWSSARERITRLASESPADRLYSYYLERIDELMRRPPAANWDGVFTHPEK